MSLRTVLSDLKPAVRKACAVRSRDAWGLKTFFFRDIQRNHFQNLDCRVLGPALSDDGVQGRFRKFRAVVCEENFHEWPSLASGRRCLRLFARRGDGNDFGHQDFKQFALYCRYGPRLIDIHG